MDACLFFVIVFLCCLNKGCADNAAGACLRAPSLGLSYKAALLRALSSPSPSSPLPGLTLLEEQRRHCRLYASHAIISIGLLLLHSPQSHHALRASIPAHTHTGLTRITSAGHDGESWPGKTWLRRRIGGTHCHICRLPRHDSATLSYPSPRCCCCRRGHPHEGQSGAPAARVAKGRGPAGNGGED